ncbi:MAG TPA: 4Fe-4S dicluster domain-containing protein [Dissulfurispiraceae bacterium]|nr:4Fe-4S dicluster domain-containing protein [Dissulfurispiraceae bacterium]
MITRRDFIKRAAMGLAGLSIPLAAVVNPGKLFAVNGNNAKVRWAFLIDTYKCVGCGLCVKACKTENEIPYDANVTRTWVERYVHLRDGRVLADTPKGARDGFITEKIDIGEGRFKDVKKEEIDKAFFVPKLCNQCENPPCVQVCPVGATYQTPDGVVLVDRSWCIGCGYCIMACPYGVRFFNPLLHVAEKCNFCYHRINRGLKPACVGACPFGARMIANIRDPEDPVTKIIRTERVNVLKSEYGTKPQAYYIGLDEEVR